MRVVGYIRETGSPADGESAFAQHEELRRHASVEGHQLVAVCSDARDAGPDREGYRSLLGVIAAGSVDGVLVPGLDTLSSDAIVQEIMLWDLRSRGVTVASTRADDAEILATKATAPSRIFIREVLTRVAEHGALVTSARPTPPPGGGAGTDADDVVVHLIRPERATADPDDSSESAAAGSAEG